MRWVEHVRMGNKNAYGDLVEKSKGITSNILANYQNNIKMNLKSTGWKVVD
jgi:hypothetical protein